ncbi:MAG: hypothetical protein PHY35_00040 [Candidatus Omnitrophica bacterium]|nr:hypothetical protein [Candidatus Omnitrophota bacterium]
MKTDVKIKNMRFFFRKIFKQQSMASAKPMITQKLKRIKLPNKIPEQ